MMPAVPVLIRSRRRRAAGVVAVAAALVLALASCGDDDDGGASGTTVPGPATTGPTATTTPAITGPSAPPTTDATATVEARVYFLRDEKVGPVARTVRGPQVATAAMEALLAGPTAEEEALGFTSAVPEGTTLRGVVVEDGVATVDLSSAFGSGGGSLSMTSRVAQVVFTLTQFPTVDAVAFELDGEPVDELGGEGVLLDEPQDRAAWEDLTPAILVESPLPGARVTSPLRITGTANTFEAAFWVTLSDATGAVLHDGPAMATSGSGTRGTFDLTVPFTTTADALMLTVLEHSAEDGRPIHEVEIPLRVGP